MPAPSSARMRRGKQQLLEVAAEALPLLPLLLPLLLLLLRLLLQPPLSPMPTPRPSSLLLPRPRHRRRVPPLPPARTPGM